jgi:hypothetical protein
VWRLVWFVAWVLRVLPHPWGVAVLGLGAVAVALVRWHHARPDGVLSEGPYGRVIPLTPDELAEWKAPTIHPGEGRVGGGDA